MLEKAKAFHLFIHPALPPSTDSGKMNDWIKSVSTCSGVSLKLKLKLCIVVSVIMI